MIIIAFTAATRNRRLETGTETSSVFTVPSTIRLVQGIAVLATTAFKVLRAPNGNIVKQRAGTP